MKTFVAELLKLAKKYQNLVVLRAALPNDLEVEQFEKFFPERYFSFGLSTSHMISAAAGMTLRGKLPVVLGMDLLDKGCEQIEEDFCAPNLNVRVVDFGGHSHLVPEQLGLGEAESVEDFVKSFEAYGAVYLRLGQE